MASESSDEHAVSAALPADLDDWLDAKAAQLSVDRETVVVQLLSAYMAASDLDDEAVEPPLAGDIESEVRDVIAQRLPDIANAVGDELDVGDVAAAEDRLSAELDRVESDFDARLQDVRERVVQVKREADGKADADHDHEEFATLSSELDEVRAHLDDIEEALERGDSEREDLADRVADLEGMADRLDDIEEKLTTVAWVVSDLRDTVEAGAGTDRAVERLKRSAATADIDRAVCDSCEQPVDIALLSEPNCPHCDATVNDVEPPGGFFGKPRLRVARQLEAGDDHDHEDSDVPDAARR
jgi:chromosome segregation ATPase